MGAIKADTRSLDYGSHGSFNISHVEAQLAIQCSFVFQMYRLRAPLPLSRNPKPTSQNPCKATQIT